MGQIYKMNKDVLIEKRTGYVQSYDGTPIYYESRGVGRPLVFVYGIACLINHWHHQLNFFSRNYQTVSYDLRGHHKSNPVTHPQDLSLNALSEDLILLLEHLKLKDVVLLGHSFGVPVLLEAYKKRPDLISHLVLINGFSKNPLNEFLGFNFVGPAHRFIKEQYDQSPILWETLWKSAIDNPLSLLLTGIIGGFNLNLTHFKDIEIYLKGVASLELNIFLKMFEEILTYNGEEVLKKINVPTLIISGEKDQVTPSQYQAEMQQQIQGAQLAELKYGSHCCQLDFPEYVNLKIESFINGAN